MIDRGLEVVIQHLTMTMGRDRLVQETTNALRDELQVDRVVLFYLYPNWSGQVTFESVSKEEFSIFGYTGLEGCFNEEYAALYQAGRVRAIADIEIEPIEACHRDFLRSLQVRANLVVPIVNRYRLWGLLVAHQCQSPYHWSPDDFEAMQKSATDLAMAPSIRNS